jgi:hypothetical protein
MSEYNYLKKWSANDLIEEKDRTNFKINKVIQEIENLNSLLDTLKERDGYINNLLVDTQPDS